MDLIANTGIQYFIFPLEIDLNNNFRMYLHEWTDMNTNPKQLKLEIAHYFPQENDYPTIWNYYRKIGRDYRKM